MGWAVVNWAAVAAPAGTALTICVPFDANWAAVVPLPGN